MKQTISALLLVFALSTSCGNQPKAVDEGKIQNQVYTSEEIGWTIKIPKGWELLNTKDGEAATEKGKGAIEKTLNQKIDVSGLQDLISFRKDKANVFISNSEKMDFKYKGEWAEHNAALKDVIYNTYINQGLKTDSSETTIEQINGLDFETYAFTIYNPQGQVVLKQILYSRFINGFDFGVCLTYNNEKWKNEMLRAFRSSKFKKR